MFRTAIAKIFNFLSWIVLIALGGSFISLMVINSQMTPIHFNPLSWGADKSGTFVAPLFIWLGLFFIVGLLVGGATVWLKQRKYRKTAWEEIDKNETL